MPSSPQGRDRDGRDSEGDPSLRGPCDGAQGQPPGWNVYGNQKGKPAKGHSIFFLRQSHLGSPPRLRFYSEVDNRVKSLGCTNFTQENLVVNLEASEKGLRFVSYPKHSQHASVEIWAWHSHVRCFRTWEEGG